MPRWIQPSDHDLPKKLVIFLLPGCGLTVTAFGFGPFFRALRVFRPPPAGGEWDFAALVSVITGGAFLPTSIGDEAVCSAFNALLGRVETCSSSAARFLLGGGDESGTFPCLLLVLATLPFWALLKKLAMFCLFSVLATGTTKSGELLPTLPTSLVTA